MTIRTFFQYFKLHIFVGLFAFFLLILGVWILLAPPSGQQSLPETQKTSPPSKTANLETIFPNKTSNDAAFPSFTQTTIGKTKENDIAAFPNLKNSTSLPDGSKEYSFSSADASRDNTVITKNGIAVFKRAATVLDQTWERPIASIYAHTYGKAEKEFTGSKTYGRFAKTAIYAKKGFAIVFNPFTDELYELQVFTPTTANIYKQRWGQDIQEYEETVPGP